MSQAIHKTVRYVIRGLGAALIGLSIGGAPAPTYAQHSMGGGGGGGHFGGGGHIGGGGHAGGGGFAGGGHAFGGGAVHFGGFGSHSYGSYGGHAFAAPHYGFSGHSYANARYGAPAAHGFSYAGARYGYVARPGFGHPGTVATHPGVGAPSATYYSHGGWYPAHAWAGGYWHGAYWPHCWYYPGWAWYLPVLPVGYVTYWWGGVPYYYWNSLYYTWSPVQNGYVVTDPPPAEGEGSADASGSYEQAPQASYGGSGSASAADVYVYPRNGQTPEQTENDRYECHSWATSQSGFDPTRPQQNGDPNDYHRAMVACLDARGYSAR